MKARNRPIIAWGLGVTASQRSLFGMRAALRASFISSFDALIAYSEVGAESYEAMGIPTEKIFVAPNAVAPAPKGNLPKRPNNFSGKARILFVGRLQARKALDRLFRACAEFPAILQPQIRVVGDGPHKAKLIELANAIYPHVDFTGSLFGADLEAEFREADLFVLPGTGGLAIQQAMAFGLPVIAGKSDGSQADLIGPENGWQLASEEVSELVSILSVALSNVDGLREKGKASFRKVKEGYNLEAMSDVFIDVLRRTSK
jgi:glycosyltransferase involved in cell wall biosynthesis